MFWAVCRVKIISPCVPSYLYHFDSWALATFVLFMFFSLKAWSSGNVWCCFCFLFYYILFFVCYLEFQCSIFFFLEGIKCSKEKWVILHNWKLSHLESFLFCLLKLIDKNILNETKNNNSTVKCHSIPI